MLSLILAAAVSATAVSTPDERAIAQAENAWSAAFVEGNGVYLATLLSPGYVSVGTTGEPHPKAAIIASALKYAAAHPGQKASAMNSSSTIEVSGDLALVHHAGAQDVSVDVFQKRSGQWTAIYSQHTAVRPKA